VAHHRRHLHPDAQGAGQAGQAAAALKFFEWAYKNGDKTADDLDYVPMPAREGQVEKLWATEIKDAAGKNVAIK
jgi:phosphate transport system substrate-binding protein